ncbi:MAG: aldehyde ferredoxin oxidoreductase family protein [Anaerolineae bacterium]
MPKGYTGKILHVDLSGGKTWIEEPDEIFYRRYIGGSAMIGYYLLKEVPKGADPLGPQNVLMFANGTITGHPIAGSGRSAVGAKSPLTGGYGEADGGGFFGAELKHAGFDMLLVHGKAPEPVYIWIKDGIAQIKSAKHLWGLTTQACSQAVQQEMGDNRIRLAMIGPGGEKLTRFACVMHDLKHAAGRTGLGAVMGSKNLKAVAVRGGTLADVADEEKFKELARWMRDHWKEDASSLYDTGTDGGLLDLHEEGALPTRNFQDGQFSGAAKIDGAAMRDSILIDRGGCYACPVRCKRVVEVKEGPYQVDPEYGGPEYETVGAFGSNCGVDDLKAISKANEYCNAYSLDTISTGMMVSFAMECFENGYLNKEETGGLDLTFGNAQAMVELTRMICEREGLGDILAEGPRAAVSKIHPDTAAYAVQVKNQPFPMHECRTRHGQALGYAVSPTGADHTHNMWDGGMNKDKLGDEWLELGIYEPMPQTELDYRKVRAYTYIANWQWLLNSLGECIFLPWKRDQIVEIVRSLTGWRTNMWELLRSGERGVTLARAFNMREGLTRADDVLPGRVNTPFVTESVTEKPVDPEVLDENMSVFYQMMGWDAQTGIPTDDRLRELDIAWVADQLK